MYPFEVAVVTRQIARDYPPRPDRDPEHSDRPNPVRYRIGTALVRAGLALQRRAAGPEHSVPRAA